MANLSKYGSEVMYVVKKSNNDIIVSQPEVHEVKYEDQNHSLLTTDDEITKDSNVIPYSQYLQDKQSETDLPMDTHAQQVAV